MASQSGVHGISYKTSITGHQNEAYAEESGVVKIPDGHPVPSTILEEDVPNDNLPLAIFSALFCNIILGGLAVWKSLEVKRQAKQGDFEEAKKAYFWTQVFAILALLTGGIAWIVAFRYWITDEY